MLEGFKEYCERCYGYMPLNNIEMLLAEDDFVLTYYWNHTEDELEKALKIR